MYRLTIDTNAKIYWDRTYWDQEILDAVYFTIDRSYRRLECEPWILAWHIENFATGKCVAAKMHRDAWQRSKDWRDWMRPYPKFEVHCVFAEFRGEHISPARKVYGWSEASYHAYLRQK